MRWAGRRLWALLGLVGLVSAPLATLVLTAPPASAVGPGCQAGNIEVTTATDAALRAAFTTANGLAGPQTICIDSGLGPITLTGGVLTYNNGANGTPALTLEGNGATINANNASGVIVISQNGPLTLDKVTITGGHAANGGGVNANGAVTVSNSTISGNSATGNGGGIDAGPVTVSNSTISGNSATGNGGGLDASTVTVTNSTLSGNTTGAGGNGGGLDASTVTVTNSTFSGNTTGAGGNGGGLDASTVTVTNSTFTGNTAGTGGIGGGVEGSVTTLVYATIVQNIATSNGANVETTDLTSFGSVVAEAKGGGLNCGVTTPTSNGFNFSDDASSAVSCEFNAATDHVGASNAPALGALGANGGPTNTMVPNAGSPLIDAIPDPGGGCPAEPTITTDQRGFARPSGPGCDIGAVEVQAAAPASPAAVTVTPKFTG